MLSDRSPQPIVIRAAPVPGLVPLIAVTHGAVLLVLLGGDGPWWFRLAGAVACVWSACEELRRIWTRRLVRITWDRDGKWWLETVTGERFEAGLVQASVYRWVMILSWRTKNGLRLVSVLAPLQTAGQAIRRLRVRLVLTPSVTSGWRR